MPLHDRDERRLTTRRRGVGLTRSDVRHRRRPLRSTASRRSRCVAAPDGRLARPSRARRRGRLRRRGSASPTGAWRSSTSPGRPPADAEPRRAVVITYNGEIYNFQELRIELEQASATAFRWLQRHRGRPPGVEPSGASTRSTRFNGMFAFALWDRERRELLLARDRYGIKPVYSVAPGPHPGLRVGGQGDLVPPRREAPGSTPRHSPSTSRSRTSSASAPCSTASALLPAGQLPEGPPEHGEVTSSHRWWDFAFTEPSQSGDPRSTSRSSSDCSPRPCSASSSPTSRVGSYLSGRHGFGVDHGDRGASIADLRTFTGGFDLRRPRAWSWPSTSASEAEHMSYLAGTEHYEMVLKAGDMERVLPRAGLAPRGPAGRAVLPELLRRPARRQVRQGRALGRRRRRALRRLPVAVLPRGRSRRTSRSTSTATTTTGSGCSPTTGASSDVLGPVCDDVAPRLDARHLPQRLRHARRAPATRAEDYINHSLYFEAKTFLHGLLRGRGQAVAWRTALETRVPFLDNDLVDFAQRLPVNLKLNDLASVVRLNENEPATRASGSSSAPATASSCCATSCAATCPSARPRR